MDSENNHNPEPEQKQNDHVEPEVVDKIRTKQIEILDSEDNVVMSIGKEDGIYPDDEKTEILTIFDTDGNATLKIGRSHIGSYIFILGSKGSVQLSATSLFSGGNISIYYVDDDKKHTISLFNGVIGGQGYISVSTKEEDIESEISIDADPEDGEVTITGKNDEIKTTKTIFKRGS